MRSTFWMTAQETESELKRRELPASRIMRKRTKIEQAKHDAALNQAMMRIAEHDAANPDWAAIEWRVEFGQSVNVYYAERFALQFAEALRMNGTACKVVGPVVAA